MSSAPGSEASTTTARPQSSDMPQSYPAGSDVDAVATSLVCETPTDGVEGSRTPTALPTSDADTSAKDQPQAPISRTSFLFAAVKGSQGVPVAADAIYWCNCPDSVGPQGLQHIRQINDQLKNTRGDWNAVASYQERTQSTWVEAMRASLEEPISKLAAFCDDVPTSLTLRQLDPEVLSNMQQDIDQGSTDANHAMDSQEVPDGYDSSGSLPQWVIDDLKAADTAIRQGLHIGPIDVHKLDHYWSDGLTKAGKKTLLSLRRLRNNQPDDVVRSE